MVDNGLFVGLAQTLAKEFGRVLYHTPDWAKGFPSIQDAIIGDGFNEFERVNDIWEVMDEVDICVFPDICHAGLQLHLESIGKRVWGARQGDSLEMIREKFLRKLEDVGLDVPGWRLITGLPKLREYLKKNEDKYVKISRWRQDLETFHHLDYDLSLGKLDELACRFGPLQDDMPFIVVDPIECIAEIGYDGYCIDGKFPTQSSYGIECKNKGYIGTLKKYHSLPQSVREVNAALSETLAGFNYRQFWSTEIRVTEDSAFFIDPTCRLGMPSGDAQLALYGNVAEIVWNGAAGILVDPKPAAKFCAQSLMSHSGKEGSWRTLHIPDEIYDFVRLLYPCKIGDLYGISPSSRCEDTIGSVIGIGDTIEEAIQHVNANAYLLKQQPVTVHVDSLADVLADIQESQDEGMIFTTGKIPEPASVIED